VSEHGAVLDLRTYELKPGAGEQFAHILEADALPMLARFGIEVVAYGRSLEDPDSCYLARRFASVAERNEQLEAFYGSAEWRTQHREQALALIDSLHVLLLPAASAVRALT
jgi:NIPSNAP